MPHQVPNSFKFYFWDVDTQTLDPVKSANFVINRLLDKGNTEAASWVLKNYSHDDIQRVFMTMRDFSPKTATFWSMYLGIPENKILCLQKPYLQQRRHHWPF